MGRPQTKIDMGKLLEQMDGEVPQKEIAASLGVSLPTLRQKIDDLRNEQGILLDSKSVENLRVIRMKTKVLERIENNLHTMEPDDLLKALGTLNKMDTPPEEDKSVKGIMGLLAAIDDEAEKRAEEKFEEKQLESNTIEVTSKPSKFPNL